ncbi:xanthomonadin biosynthesis protein [Dyella sp. KRB-257]|uniref:xanthomonadin biosynthesis protein n=1 Tax=Dyella sp. KRB-257 TaxID=3400915 RepID=UPI003C05F09F
MPARAFPLRRATLALLPLYPALAIGGALTHRAALSLAALLLLVTLWLLPRLLAGSVRPWIGWGTAVLLACASAWLGLADRLLDAVPPGILAGLALWFGATLRAGREPRVARFIRVLEGEAQLARPGVARYARGVTVFWTVLLALQALILAALWLRGLFDATDLPRWALAYQHVGGYLLIPLAFTLEYAFRRWHLRHVQHPGLHAQALQMMRHWPQLLHDTHRHR